MKDKSLTLCLIFVFLTLVYGSFIWFPNITIGLRALSLLIGTAMVDVLIRRPLTRHDVFFKKMIAIVMSIFMFSICKVNEEACSLTLYFLSTAWLYMTWVIFAKEPVKEKTAVEKRYIPGYAISEAFWYQNVGSRVVNLVRRVIKRTSSKPIRERRKK